MRALVCRQHFATRDGSGLWERHTTEGGPRKCLPRCEALGARFREAADWRNAAVEAVARELAFPREQIVRLAALQRPMWALHSPGKFACSPDCTHFCYHPRFWAAQLDGVYRHLLNWAARTTRTPGAGSSGGADGV